MKTALVDSAAKVLAEEGPAAVSVRRLAAEVGASTMVVYTAFGGKDGLLAAVRSEAFARFHRRLSAVRHTDDPVRDLTSLGLAYRRFARAEPYLYEAMFGRTLARIEVTSEEERAARATFDILVAAMERAGFDDAEGSAHQMWAAVHGFVTLELAGMTPHARAARAYEQLLLTVGSGLLTRRS